MGLGGSYKDTLLRAGDTRDTARPWHTKAWDTMEQRSSLVHTMGPRTQDTGGSRPPAPGPQQCLGPGRHHYTLGPRAFAHYRGSTRARRPYRYMNNLNTGPPAMDSVGTAMDNLGIATMAPTMSSLPPMPPTMATMPPTSPPLGNPVGALHQRYQEVGAGQPVYEVGGLEGEAHRPTFRVQLTTPEGMVVQATGNTKKMAKNTAASMVLARLGVQGGVEEGVRGGEGALEELVGVGREGLGELGVPFLERLLEEQGMGLVMVVLDPSKEGERKDKEETENKEGDDSKVEDGKPKEGKVEVLAQVCALRGRVAATVSLGRGATEGEARARAAATILAYFHTLYSV